ncbi:sporulation-specific Dnase NucB [soil metagenome]
MARLLRRALALALLIGALTAPDDVQAPVPSHGCVRTDRVVDVGLSRIRYPNVLAHAERAAAQGWPSVYVITRRAADTRRDRLLRDIPTRRGYDRDEVPPAIGRGRGNGLTAGRDPRGWKADVEYVPSGENRGAGSVMGIKLRRFCGGTRFRYVGY